MKIINRLADYIEYKGISLNSFDKAIGTANGYIGKQIKNNASIGVDIIEKIICVYSDLSVEWLITGKKEMIKGYAQIDKTSPGVEEGKPPNNESYEANKEIIRTQRETIETQRKYICRLEGELDKKNGKQEEPDEVGQKRKVV
jgi:hypothetical protein